MNIKEAKEQISKAMRAYFAKDEFGNYVIPLERQRPVFLLGAPGIGKTAIMEQIAQELGVALVSYSMTHHTRQSAIGLPFITQKSYGGKTYDVSEYTMSEIIASVYDVIEESGLSEGILFLDEINCVSETLSPAILQFLQYKIFGRHQIPQGWIVVTAGNPAEYNRNIHDFDIATWDRLKRIDVEPNYEVWKEYALKSGVHPAITSYLELRPGDFYKVEKSVDGKRFVTARAWDDLSHIIQVYEREGIAVDSLLMGQYIQDPEISKRFAVYYELFLKYQSDYGIDDIIAGQAAPAAAERLSAAGFEEKISFIALLLSACTSSVDKTVAAEDAAKAIHAVLSELKAVLEAGAEGASEQDVRTWLLTQLQELKAEFQKLQTAGSLKSRDKHARLACIDFLEGFAYQGEAVSFDQIKAAFAEHLDALDQATQTSALALDSAFAFLEGVFGSGQEILLFITDLSSHDACIDFIQEHGCEAYFKHNENLQFAERGAALKDRIRAFQEAKDEQ